MWWFPVLLGLAGAVVAAWRLRRRLDRQRRLMELCRRAGLSFMPLDPYPDTLWLPFAVFGRGTRRGAENVVWDPRDDAADVRAFDYWYAQEGEQGAEVIRRMTCAVAQLPFGVPRLDVVPRGPLAIAAGAAGTPEVAMELETFNRRFHVVTDDRRFAVAFLDQRMMEALLALPHGIACSVNEDRLLLWALDLAAAQMLMMLEVARRLPGRVPSVVASLYPPRPAEGPHEARWLQGQWSPDPTVSDP